MMEDAVRRSIEAFVAGSPGNRFPGTGEPFFTEPLVGFAAATDPLFTMFKKVVGDFHRTPQEVLASTEEGEMRAATVICWILPVSQATRVSNRREERFPSREWAVTRNDGEIFNSALRRHLVDWLRQRGYRAVAPQLVSAWRQLTSPEIGIASTWSERHAAYAAGLGTFSLSDGFITVRGIAHRIGSVITDLALTPTPRTVGDHLHNCLWYREQSCGLCIGRCPVGAITSEGHDKETCRNYVYGTIPDAVAAEYGVTQTGCGLCQAGVPCEAAVPLGRGERE